MSLPAPPRALAPLPRGLAALPRAPAARRHGWARACGLLLALSLQACASPIPAAGAANGPADGSADGSAAQQSAAASSPLLQALQGSWVAQADPHLRLRIAGDVAYWEDHGQPAGRERLSLLRACPRDDGGRGAPTSGSTMVGAAAPPSRGANPRLLLQALEGPGPDHCWEILAIDGQALHLRHVGSNVRQVYRRRVAP